MTDDGFVCGSGCDAWLAASTQRQPQYNPTRIALVLPFVLPEGTATAFIIIIAALHSSTLHSCTPALLALAVYPRGAHRRSHYRLEADCDPAGVSSSILATAWL